ncbi:MAG: YXWGXW repeat-containing protein [Pseudomonadota bacterium]
MARIALYAVCLTAVAGCVIGRSTRPTLNESAQGPSAAPVTGSPIVPQTTPEDGEAPPEKPKPGATWVRGYWHWDGVRYVWQRGRWQDDAPAAPAAP